jgi:dolichol-phosphate mannosyltransferase
MAALIISVIIIGYLALSVADHFFFGKAIVPGWPSLIISIVALGAMNLVCVGILGEYVGRIYEQVKQRPLYFVRDATSKPDSPNQVDDDNLHAKK